ncbi:ribosome-associated protein [Serratia plymuthica]|uniref:Ribosome-associated protein n=1 Tax=Serratia plymuthica TaxID=82996 RepID=A0A2X4U3W7_SERPL|nr:ribosome-associated protein [Serratia plymuthica]
METFNLDSHPHVELCDLLKFQGWCESGGAAKEVIAEGLVKVNGKVERANAAKSSPIRWWSLTAARL